VVVEAAVVVVAADFIFRSTNDLGEDNAPGLRKGFGMGWWCLRKKPATPTTELGRGLQGPLILQLLLVLSNANKPSQQA
jgi:hypothetical protein